MSEVKKNYSVSLSVIRRKFVFQYAFKATLVSMKQKMSKLQMQQS